MSIVLNSFKYFISTYNESIFKKSLLKIKDISSKSVTADLFNRYINKKPYYENSLSSKFFVWLFSVINIVMVFLNKIFTPLFKNSTTVKSTTSLKKLSTRRKTSLTSILIVSISIGFSGGCIIQGIGYNIPLLLLFTVLAVFLILFSKYAYFYKESIIYKFFKYLLD